MKIISLFIVCFCFLPAIAQNEEPLKAGMKAPGFSYRDVDGNVVCLKDLRGKYVYIDVWATCVCPVGENCPL